MDEAILDVVEVVDVIHNCLTLILHKMLDKGISADGSSEANVAVNHKARRRDSEAEDRGDQGRDLARAFVSMIKL